MSNADFRFIEQLLYYLDFTNENAKYSRYGSTERGVASGFWVCSTVVQSLQKSQDEDRQTN